MKFSLIYEAQTVDASREGERRVYDEMVEQCLLAEEVGFDVVWAVEHTALTNHAHLSAPESFLACTRTESLATAGARGLGAPVLGFGGPEEVAKKNALYRSSFADRKPEDQVGYRPISHLAALCPAIVLEDGRTARRIGVRGQRYFMESLAYWYTGGPKPDHAAWADEDMMVESTTGEQVIRSRWASEEVVVDFSDPSLALLNPNHAYGTVRDAIGYVERLRAAGADEILFICQMGTVPQWAQLETIRNIGEHVMPHFRR